MANAIIYRVEYVHNIGKYSLWLHYYNADGDLRAEHLEYIDELLGYGYAMTVALHRALERAVALRHYGVDVKVAASGSEAAMEMGEA